MASLQLEAMRQEMARLRTSCAEVERLQQHNRVAVEERDEVIRRLRGDVEALQEELAKRHRVADVVAMWPRQGGESALVRVLKEENRTLRSLLPAARAGQPAGHVDALTTNLRALRHTALDIEQAQEEVDGDK